MPLAYLVDGDDFDEMRKEIEMLHAENALKLTQILGLERLLYLNRMLDEEDGSPCWCVNPLTNGEVDHSFNCIKARQATEPFWKK